MLFWLLSYALGLYKSWQGENCTKEKEVREFADLDATMRIKDSKELKFASKKEFEKVEDMNLKKLLIDIQTFI